MVDLSVNLAGISLKNPVMPASGTAAYGQGLADKLNLGELGALVIKSTTLEPRQGNLWPTTAQTTGGWLNAVGLKNPGIKVVLEDKLPWLATHYPDLPIVGSIAGATEADYLAVAQQMASAPNVALLEVNISCPNVAHGGLAFGTDPKTIARLTSKIKTVVDKPVFMKLTPNVTDVTQIAAAAERGGADGFTMINTLTGLSFDLATGQPLLANGTGGLSGAGLHPIAIRMIRQVRQQSRLPIIGVGGNASAEDVLEMFIAGANAVQIGAANYHNPTACTDIIAALPNVMTKYGINSLQALSDRILTEVGPKNN